MSAVAPATGSALEPRAACPPVCPGRLERDSGRIVRRHASRSGTTGEAYARQGYGSQRLPTGTSPCGTVAFQAAFATVRPCHCLSWSTCRWWSRDQVATQARTSIRRPPSENLPWGSRGIGSPLLSSETTLVRSRPWVAASQVTACPAKKYVTVAPRRGPRTHGRQARCRSTSRTVSVNSVVASACTGDSRPTGSMKRARSSSRGVPSAQASRRA